MLVLTRKSKEKIRIGDNITVTILRVKGRSVQIGIEAPIGIRIMRSELPVNEFAATETEPEAAASAPAIPSHSCRPIVAEAALSHEEFSTEESNDHSDHDEMPAFETNANSRNPTEAPLSFHIARRFRIINPNKNSKPTQRSSAIAAS